MTVTPLLEINTTLVPRLRSDFQALKTTLQVLRGAANINQLTLSIGATPQEGTQAVTDYVAELDRIIGDIDNIIGITPAGDLQIISNSASQLTDSIISVNTSATTVIVKLDLNIESGRAASRILQSI
jgi:soluble cytochrome b562